MAIDCGVNVVFDGQQNITVYDSSDRAQRGFCNLCGSHLFYRVKQSQHHMMPAGLFDNNESFVFDHQVFIDFKPSYYSFSNDTKNQTAAQFLHRRLKIKSCRFNTSSRLFRMKFK